MVVGCTQECTGGGVYTGWYTPTMVPRRHSREGYHPIHPGYTTLRGYPPYTPWVYHPERLTLLTHSGYTTLRGTPPYTPWVHHPERYTPYTPWVYTPCCAEWSLFSLGAMLRRVLPVLLRMRGNEARSIPILW